MPVAGFNLWPEVFPNGGVDLHCHILPGLDDGPETMSDALALCRAMVREGISVAVATPHELGRYDQTNSASLIRQRVEELSEHLRSARIDLTVVPGAEVRLDERIPRLLEEDTILTLADRRRHLLLELPPGPGVFDPLAVIGRICGAGVQVVLAHAERFDSLRRDPSLAGRWVDAGAILQVNASSLTGSEGPAEQQAAWSLLERGLARIVATDAHSLGQRRPRWAQAVGLILQRLGVDSARQLCAENPRRVIEGRPIE